MTVVLFLESHNIFWASIDTDTCLHSLHVILKVIQDYHKTRNMSGRPVLYSDFHILITVVATCSLLLPIFLMLQRELVNQKAKKHSRVLILSSKTSCFLNEDKC